MTVYSNIDIGIERERKRETRIKRWTYTRIMSDNVADHYYRYSRRREKQTRSRDVYGHTMRQSYPKTSTDIQRERKEIGIKRRTHTRKIKKE